MNWCSGVVNMNVKVVSNIRNEEKMNIKFIDLL